MATEAACRAFYDRIEKLREEAYEAVLQRVGDQTGAVALFVGTCTHFAEELQKVHPRGVLGEYVGWHSLIGSTPVFKDVIAEDLPLNRSVEAFYRRIIAGTEPLRRN